MWITEEVELPDDLVDAAVDGKLVVFAGAGVSMGSPSDLPSFETLALRIADGAVARAPNEDFDRFLGRCAQQGVNVQERCRRMLDVPTSKPTLLHRELVKLLGKPDRVRVVTTNFDRHFTTVAAEIFGPGAFLPRHASSGRWEGAQKEAKALAEAILCSALE